MAAATKIDLRTCEGRKRRGELQQRALELRKRGLTLAQISDEIGSNPYTIQMMLWDAIGLGAMQLNRQSDRQGAQKALVTKGHKNPWEIPLRAKGQPFTLHVDPDNDDAFRGMYDAAGNLIADPGIAEIELICWEMHMDGELESIIENGKAYWRLVQ